MSNSSRASGRKLGKKVLSLYLRTKCQRELYLSLHPDSLLKSEGLPVPTEPRMGVAILKDEGISFEQERTALLNKALKGLVYESPQSLKSHEPLETALGKIAGEGVITQGFIAPQQFRAQALGNLGVDTLKQPLLPPLDGLIPDIIVVRGARADEEEITPDGSRRPIASDEARRALVIIDVKHTGQANASYSAEVVLYTFMLANWLQFQGLDGQYYASSRVGLWTRSHENDSQFKAALDAEEPLTPSQWFEKLEADCDSVYFPFYLPLLRRIFSEDIPRVIEAGDADWQQLPWHVNQRCASCDWLGYKPWLNAADGAKVEAHPDHYCHRLALDTDDLSRLPGLSQAACATLREGGHDTVADIKFLDGTDTSNDALFRSHAMLRREKMRLNRRAMQLGTGESTRDEEAQFATLGKDAQLQVCVSVNFDSSAGLLTGLAARGRVSYPWRSENRVNPETLNDFAAPVEEKTPDFEWATLRRLLETISGFYESAQQKHFDNGYGEDKAADKIELRVQIVFWDKRQFEALCGAMGRHLGRVLALSDNRARALAWLFPADEMLGQVESNSPPIAFLSDVVRRAIFADTPHAITLLDVAGQYHYKRNAVNPDNPFETDRFYRELMTDGIPRERIYEIWSRQPLLKRGKSSKTRGEVINEFSMALRKQVRALDSVMLQIFTDFKDQLKAQAPKLYLKQPAAKRLPLDSRLWIWWDELDTATTKIEDQTRFAADAVTLEATYEAIRLRSLIEVTPAGFYRYTISADSTEARLEVGQGFLTLGRDDVPAFPLLSVPQSFKRCGEDVPQPLLDEVGGRILKSKVHQSLSAKLIELNTITGEAVVEIETHPPTLLESWLQNEPDWLHGGLTLFKAASPTGTPKVTADLLREIKSPAIAVPDPRTFKALGADSPDSGNTKKGVAKAIKSPDPITPVARVLWDAAQLQNEIVSPTAQASAEFARTRDDLNDSQTAAVKHALERALTVIWGPPGTGKTQTLAAALHAEIRAAIEAGSPLKIFLGGPTYKAVEELFGRLLRVLAADAGSPCSLFFGYSRSHEDGGQSWNTEAEHLVSRSFHFADNDAVYGDCIRDLLDASSISVVATVCHQAHKIGEQFNRAQSGEADAPLLARAFDIVVLDESSQIPVARSLGALGLLKEKSRTIVAGDHLQMPPIFQLEPPKGSEFLVGSIQTYLLERDFGGQKVDGCDLLTNYRSHQQIVDYALTLGYNPGLHAHFSDTQLELVSPVTDLRNQWPSAVWSESWSEILDPSRPLLTLLHDDPISSQGNQNEADIVASLVASLRQSVALKLSNHPNPPDSDTTEAQQFWKQSIGIVTPHRAQRKLILEALREFFPDEGTEMNEAVHTVEKFQGGERHTIIVSFGVGDPDIIAGEEAFLMQLERINVAVSRAMAKCIVIMPTTLAGHVPEDKKAVATAHALKGFVDEFCNLSQKVEIHFPAPRSVNGTLRWHG